MNLLKEHEVYEIRMVQLILGGGGCEPFGVESP